jgi:hypothetical protein
LRNSKKCKPDTIWQKEGCGSRRDCFVEVALVDDDDDDDYYYYYSV